MGLQTDEGGDLKKFRRILVTGASGFLGRPLVERLEGAGCDVTALGRSRKASPFKVGVEYRVGDLADKKRAFRLLAPWRWDAVVNLAGPVPRACARREGDYSLLQHVNIALHVCLAIPRGWPGRLIHVSSMTVYGMPGRLPVAESHPRKPVTVYGMAKALAEDVVGAVALQHHVDCWVLRLPGLFSETRHDGALSHFMRAAADRRRLVVSAAEPTPWDVLHVEDAVEAIMRALVATQPSPGTINISYGSPVELVAIAKEIAARGGTSSLVERRAAVRHPTFQMDITIARQVLGWPPTTLQVRLDRMWKAVAHGGVRVPG